MTQFAALLEAFNVRTGVTLEQIGALIEGQHENPFALLGPHAVECDGRRALAVRAYLPNSPQAWLVDQSHDKLTPMRRIHPAGIFETICPWDAAETAFEYQLQVADESGNMNVIHDPYAFPSLYTDFDLFLLGEGTHYQSYERMGAQLRTINGVAGVNFSVWAPNAQAISLIGDFNRWDGRQHQLRKHGNGIWELFVPGLKAGEVYKYRVKTKFGETVDKTDPYGFAAELPPKTASIVTDLSTHTWNDSAWMDRRRKAKFHEEPISIYEVHLGSWKKSQNGKHGWKNYRELAHELVAYCQKMNFTHLELMPVSEHPFSGSWGYQTVGYFAATSRYGTPEDFQYFVDYCHQNGIGVILDWVPAHFPKDGHGLRRFDGTACYEHEDPRQGEHPDWGTMVFNYDRNEVRNFLISNALFWLDKYHIDGLRVDAVASMLYLDYSRKEGEWIPNKHGGRENLGAISLLQEFNRQAHARFPGVLTIAEESTAWGGVSRPTDSGGLGFSMKWNMGWMNDTLKYMHRDPIYRRFHQNDLTFSLIYAFTENFVLPFSHDEVVHGKGAMLAQMAGDPWQKFANLRLLYAYQWSHPGKKLMFMGGEFGQWNEWNYDAELQWDLLNWNTHRGLQNLVSDLNSLYKKESALHFYDFEGHGFEWIDCQSGDDSLLAYLRKSKDGQEKILVVANFTPVVRRNYRIGVPTLGWYQEIFNSDSEYYGGSNVGNFPGMQADAIEKHGRPASLNLTLPPLSVSMFKLGK